MCNSHLDHHLMVRDTEARLDGLKVPQLSWIGPALVHWLVQIGKKIGLLLKGFVRV